MTADASAARRSAAALLACLVALWLAGCAAVLPVVEREPSKTLRAPPDTPLATLGRDAGLAAGTTGVWPLLQGSYALDARLALIEHATTSLDLQYYLVADDSTGHLVLRALRDAARRGVRVRLLVDDLYTADTDRLLQGLAVEPNVEVRLFNPFITERGSSSRRLLALALDFRRLNHRMHNKLFIADGAVAVVGGRNLADEYFLRGTRGNFIDFDLLASGAVVPELSGWFDIYWNSEPAFPLADVLRASGAPTLDPVQLERLFDARTMPREHEPPLPPSDYFDAPPLGVQLATRRVHLLPAEALSFADGPGKIDPANNSIAVNDTLAHRFLQTLGDARSDVLLISPYFIPGPRLMEALAERRRAGARVRVVTNSLAVSDEPLVSVRFESYQIALLNLGVELYELSSQRLKLDRGLRNLLGNSTGRLHAKLGVIDGNTVLVGSMNLDPRSSSINTEMGVAVRNPLLGGMILRAFHIEEMLGVYQVRLKPDGRGVRWTAAGPDNADVELDVDPDTTLWQRVQLLLLSLFVPESQL